MGISMFILFESAFMPKNWNLTTSARDYTPCYGHDDILPVFDIQRRGYRLSSPGTGTPAVAWALAFLHRRVEVGLP